MKHALCLFLALLLCLGLAAINHHSRGLCSPAGNLMLHGRGYHILDYTYAYFDDVNWQLSSRHVYHYNAQIPARIDSVEVMQWDYELCALLKVETYIYGYDAWGRVTSVRYMDLWDGEYTLGGRDELQYDNQHRLIKMVWFGIDDNGAEYVGGRTHIIYSGELLSEIVDYDYSIYDQEIDYYRTVFSTDNQGRIISDLEYESPDSLNWELNWQVSYAYHPNDTSTGQDFVEFVAAMYYTDSEGEALVGMPFMWSQRIDQEYNGSGWDDSYRYTYTWQTPENRLVQSLNEYWDGSAWFNEYQNTLSYDANGNCTWLMGWEWTDSSTWQESNRIQYTWGSFVANDDPVLPAAPMLSLKAWPLPFASEVNLVAASDKSGEVELTIYNLRGQELRKLNGMANASLNWDGRDALGKPCASGIYFVKARQGRQTCTERILKLK